MFRTPAQFLATSCIGGADASSPPRVAATIDYGTAKTAAVNLSKSLAQEFDGRGIRVAASLRAVPYRPWLGEHCVAETLHERTTRATARDGRAKAVATGRFSAPEKVAT